MRNLAQGIKPNATEIQQGGGEKVCVIRRHRKDIEFASEEGRVKSSCAGIPCPTHEHSILSFLSGSHIKGKMSHGFPELSHLPDVIPV